MCQGDTFENHAAADFDYDKTFLVSIGFGSVANALVRRRSAAPFSSESCFDPFIQPEGRHKTLPEVIHQLLGR